MPRPLSEKYRKGSTIQPGHDLNVLGEGWLHVKARDDISDAHGTRARLTLAGREEPFWVQLSARYLTRFNPA